MTRRQLATASGTSERYLANIESGVGNPSLGILNALAQALGLPVADLLPLGGERDEAHAEACALLRRLPQPRIAAAIDWIRQSTPLSGAKAHRIVLIGLRGAGKSSLGKALAERLEMPFLELSKEVERAYGGKMGLLIELGGQNALRRYEHEAWDSVVRAHEAAVIATPGGIVADPVLYERVLQTAHSVWLSAKPEDHMARVMAQGDFRPMASNRGAMADLKAILDARAADYARADTQVDTSKRDFAETLGALERAARTTVGM
jgi:XRE family aerobic/anaerobic benzoate catabolism transcriptional regulator